MTYVKLSVTNQFFAVQSQTQVVDLDIARVGTRGQDSGNSAVLEHIEFAGVAFLGGALLFDFNGFRKVRHNFTGFFCRLPLLGQLAFFSASFALGCGSCLLRGSFLRHRHNRSQLQVQTTKNPLYRQQLQSPNSVPSLDLHKVLPALLAAFTLSCCRSAVRNGGHAACTRPAHPSSIDDARLLVHAVSRGTNPATLWFALSSVLRRRVFLLSSIPRSFLASQSVCLSVSLSVDRRRFVAVPGRHHK